MAILLPPIDWGFISRLSKDYDFYQEFGRTVVRLYPRHIRQPRTPLQQHTWNHLKLQQATWNLIGPDEHDAWKRLTGGSTWRSRDYHARLVLKQLATAGHQWTSAVPISRGYILGGPFKVSAKILVASPWRIHFRIQLPGYYHSPATWTHVGHKIRNKRFLRKWSLSLDLPDSNPGQPDPPNMHFYVYWPPQPCRIWYQLRALPQGEPPTILGQSGLYYFDVPAP